MKKTKTLVFLILNLILVLNLSAQGISRSSGIGIRASIWRPHNIGSEVNVGISAVTTTVGSGEGGYLYYYTRLKENWYLETMFGSTGNVIFTKIGTLGTFSTEMSVTPLLFGARNDFLSLEHGSIFQPYWSFGGGLHWISMVRSSTVQGVDAKIGSDSQIGAYLGSGINVLLSSRFAINADLKYHLLEFNPQNEYSNFEYAFGLTYMWGDNPEIFRIEEIKLNVEDIYPAYYQFYDAFPLAFVRVRNMVSYPIEVNVVSNVRNYSERSQESGFVKILAGETEDINIYGLFGDKLLQASERKPAVLDLELEARAGVTHTISASINVIVHSRNAWNGEVSRLKFFITPDNQEIMKISRSIIDQNPDIDKSSIKNFLAAKGIFNVLQTWGLSYQSDPNIPYYKDDYVQFAMETKHRGAGDCDDLVVLYASLLESLGIETAFVQVKDPEKETAHLYLIFDTGIQPENGGLITSNEKRYIIREKPLGNSSIWIPVETTLVDQGFDAAWNYAAMAYLQEGVIRVGIADGWVQIFDVD
ncbi:hypothetical protein ACFLSX_03105 [Calditrichota bacterium]